MDLIAQPHRIIASGAFGIALTTAAEVLTAPYSVHVTVFELNPAVHVVKVAAAIVFVAGLLALVAHDRTALGRAGTGAVVALAVGTGLGAVPYSVVETGLDPGLSPAEASSWLDAAYADQLMWVGHLAAAGMLMLLVGLVTLAVVVLRRGLLPWWRPAVSLGAIPLAVLAGVLGEVADLPVPHPPAWIFLGIGIAYSSRLRPATLGSERQAGDARPGVATLR